MTMLTDYRDYLYSLRLLVSSAPKPYSNHQGLTLTTIEPNKLDSIPWTPLHEGGRSEHCTIRFSVRVDTGFVRELDGSYVEV